MVLELALCCVVVCDILAVWIIIRYSWERLRLRREQARQFAVLADRALVMMETQIKAYEDRGFPVPGSDFADAVERECGTINSEEVKG